MGAVIAFAVVSAVAGVDSDYSLNLTSKLDLGSVEQMRAEPTWQLSPFASWQTQLSPSSRVAGGYSPSLFLSPVAGEVATNIVHAGGGDFSFKPFRKLSMALGVTGYYGRVNRYDVLEAGEIAGSPTLGIADGNSVETRSFSVIGNSSWQMLPRWMLKGRLTTGTSTLRIISDRGRSPAITSNFQVLEAESLKTLSPSEKLGGMATISNQVFKSGFQVFSTSLQGVWTKSFASRISLEARWGGQGALELGSESINLNLSPDLSVSARAPTRILVPANWSATFRVGTLVDGLTTEVITMGTLALGLILDWTPRFSTGATFSSRTALGGDLTYNRGFTSLGLNAKYKAIAGLSLGANAATAVVESQSGTYDPLEFVVVFTATATSDLLEN